MQPAEVEPAATVYVVDDDPSMLRSMARLLRVAGYNVETFASPLTFLDREAPATPGCLLLDLNLPEMSGLSVQRALTERHSLLPVIFITACGDVPAAAKAFKAGAVDFLTKPFSDQELLAVIEPAVAKHRALLESTTHTSALKGRFETLTPREKEVAVLVARGMLNKQVAAELGIVEKTVKVHRARAMEKLEVGSLAELVDLLREIGTR